MPSYQQLADKYINKGVRPYPFQIQGLSFIQKTNGRCLLADEMGLGKSIQTILWLIFNEDVRPALLIVPARLKDNWHNEFKKWLKDGSYTLQVIKTSNDILDPNADFVVSSYDVVPHAQRLKPRQRIKLSNIGNQINERKFKAIIIDEAHMLANSKTKRTKAIKKIAQDIEHIICLTGTPLRNRPSNFYNILELINPQNFNNFFSYAHRYCDATKDHFGWNFDGHSNLNELSDKIKPFTLRRLKKNVLKDLPDKQYSYIPVKLNQIPTLSRCGNYANLVKSIGDAKIDPAIDFILRFKENNPDEKLVIFAHHYSVIDGIYDRLKKDGESIEKIDGRDGNKTYNKIVQMFQEDNHPKYLIVGIRGAQGYNLTKASNALFVEMLYVPSDLRQAEDRHHRIGQKNSVNIYYLVAQGTWDEQMLNILNSKSEVIGEIMGKSIGDNDLREYLKDLAI